MIISKIKLQQKTAPVKKSTKTALNNNTVSNEQRVVGSGVAAAAAGSNQGQGANLACLSVTFWLILS